MGDKAAVVDNYAREHLDMTADIDIMDNDRKFYPLHPESPLSKKFCEVANECDNVRLLCQDCMCHFCNKFAYRITKQMFLGRAVLDLEMSRPTTAKIHPAWLHVRNLRL